MHRFLPLMLPILVMVLLTSVVAVRMFAVRIAEMKRRRIHPQKLATSQGTAQLESLQVSDNFRNLFEMPVLFYLLCVLLMITGQQGTLFIAAAWLYVVLRVAHSWIHCTYNKVLHRFYAFAASFAVLVAMWAGFAATLLPD